MKKILLFVFLFIFVLSACVSPTPTKTPKPTDDDDDDAVAEIQPEPEISVFREAQDEKPIRFAHQYSSHPFMVLVKGGFLKACDDYGLICDISAVEGADEAKVVSYVEAMTTENTSGVVMIVHTPSRFVSAQLLVDAEIPLVAPHVVVNPEDVSGLIAWAAPNGVEYSHGAGKALAEEVECAGPVAVSQLHFNELENEVAANFRIGFLEVCPDTELLETVTFGAEADMAKSISVASAVIQAHPDLKAAFATTADGPTVWALAAEENGKEVGEIAITGMDYTRVNLDKIQSGDAFMLIAQPAFEEGYYSVVLLVNHLMGLPVPYENYLPAPQVTLENVDDFYEINDVAEAYSK